MNSIKVFFALFFVSIMVQNCVSVKEYEKNYVNDSEMQLSTKKSAKTENDGGKNGGGCGCN